MATITLKRTGDKVSAKAFQTDTAQLTLSPDARCGVRRTSLHFDLFAHVDVCCLKLWPLEGDGAYCLLACCVLNIFSRSLGLSART